MSKVIDEFEPNFVESQIFGHGPIADFGTDPSPDPGSIFQLFQQ